MCVYVCVCVYIYIYIFIYSCVCVLYNPLFYMFRRSTVILMEHHYLKPDVSSDDLTSFIPVFVSGIFRF